MQAEVIDWNGADFITGEKLADFEYEDAIAYVSLLFKKATRLLGVDGQIRAKYYDKVWAVEALLLSEKKFTLKYGNVKMDINGFLIECKPQDLGASSILIPIIKKDENFHSFRPVSWPSRIFIQEKRIKIVDI